MILSLLVQQGRKLQILSGGFGKKEHLCCDAARGVDF
jgi:hypothetical protein